MEYIQILGVGFNMGGENMLKTKCTFLWWLCFSWWSL